MKRQLLIAVVGQYPARALEALKQAIRAEALLVGVAAWCAQPTTVTRCYQEAALWGRPVALAMTVLLVLALAVPCSEGGPRGCPLAHCVY